MAQTIIKMKCTDQALEIIEAPVIASGGFKEDAILFEFCPLWDGFIKTATFYIKKGETYYAELDSDNTCIIPHEVLEKAGNIFFGVVGVNSDNITRTSEVIKYKIVQGAISEDHKPSDPTPDIYEQILARLNSITTGGLIVDSALSPTSTNPIQNQTVYEALEGKASTKDVQGIQGNLEATREDLELVKNAVNSASASIQEIEGDITEATITWNETKETASQNTTKITETDKKLDETKLSLEGHLNDTENPHSVTPDKIGALSVTGGTMTGDINMGGQKVSNLAEPTEDGDGVPKSYVDSRSVDYIVEQGTDNAGFTFRKWNSGISEYFGYAHQVILWGTTLSDASTAQAYYSTNSSTLNFKSGLFIDLPFITATCKASGYVVPSIQQLTASYVEFVHGRFYGGNDSLEVYTYIHAMGRWK